MQFNNVSSLNLQIDDINDNNTKLLKEIFENDLIKSSLNRSELSLELNMKKLTIKEK